MTQEQILSKMEYRLSPCLPPKKRLAATLKRAKRLAQDILAMQDYWMEPDVDAKVSTSKAKWRCRNDARYIKVSYKTAGHKTSH